MANSAPSPYGIKVYTFPKGERLIVSGARGETGRPAGAATDQIRACHQPEDSEGARPRSPGDGARARRRGDRVSNCVVGSGGSRLPCSTIAEHSVEGCDHFSH